MNETTHADKHCIIESLKSMSCEVELRKHWVNRMFNTEHKIIYAIKLINILILAKILYFTNWMWKYWNKNQILIESVEIQEIIKMSIRSYKTIRLLRFLTDKT